MNTQNQTCVILGVTGSIAAYKACDIASALTKEGVDTHVILTENAAKIIQPIAFSTLTGNNCITKTFDDSINYQVAHVALAKEADVLAVAPASADIIAKLALGIADDMLTTTALACTCKKLISPAMNTRMYENPLVQENLQKLRDQGWIVVEPDSGVLACKDTGKGKFPKPERITEKILSLLNKKEDLKGLKILVTAGPTQESLDPVRFLSNHSSGKMGFALAEEARDRGADVTLVAGPVSLKDPEGIKVVHVKSAQDMFDAVTAVSDGMDIILKAAAVADYTPVRYADQKIKKDENAPSESCLNLKRTRDILKYLGEHKPEGQFLCGFSMETENLIENSRKKLKKKNTDMICANSLRQKGAGFQTDTNVVTLITETDEKELPLQSKKDTASDILDTIQKNLKK